MQCYCRVCKSKYDSSLSDIKWSMSTRTPNDLCPTCKSKILKYNISLYENYLSSVQSGTINHDSSHTHNRCAVV